MNPAILALPHLWQNLREEYFEIYSTPNMRPLHRISPIASVTKFPIRVGLEGIQAIFPLGSFLERLSGNLRSILASNLAIPTWNLYLVGSTDTSPAWPPGGAVWKNKHLPRGHSIVE